MNKKYTLLFLATFATISAITPETHNTSLQQNINEMHKQFDKAKNLISCMVSSMTDVVNKDGIDQKKLSGALCCIDTLKTQLLSLYQFKSVPGYQGMVQELCTYCTFPSVPYCAQVRNNIVSAHGREQEELTRKHFAENLSIRNITEFTNGLTRQSVDRKNTEQSTMLRLANTWLGGTIFWSVVYSICNNEVYIEPRGAIGFGLWLYFASAVEYYFNSKEIKRLNKMIDQNNKHADSEEKQYKDRYFADSTRLTDLLNAQLSQLNHDVQTVVGILNPHFTEINRLLQGLQE